MKGITFGNLHTYDDLQLILTTKEIGVPTVKSKKIDIEARTVCLCTVTAAGLVHFARYRLGNTWSDAVANTWLPIDISFILG